MKIAESRMEGYKMKTLLQAQIKQRTWVGKRELFAFDEKSKSKEKIIC